MTKSAQTIVKKETGKLITILIVDDHPLVRSALKNIIEAQPNMKVVAEACNGEEAIELTRKLQPQIIIMDIGMPVMNGLEATKLIKRSYPNIAILVLTVHTDNEHVLGILEAGAAGYITKVAFDTEIICAIQAIATGETVLTPSIFQQILGSTQQKKGNIGNTMASLTDYNLTSRDVDILKLAAKGLSNRHIASELYLSEFTVKSYLSDIFSKINVSSRTEAVITCLQAGYLDLSDLK